MERIPFLELPNCYRFRNDAIELIVATDIGPRILSYGYRSKPNIFGVCPEAGQKTSWGEWKPRGGHRLWVAPENMPRSYEPDNSPVHFSVEDNHIRLRGEIGQHTGLQKEMLIAFPRSGSEVRVLHRLTNEGCWPIDISLWALTIMRAGGVAIVPQEPFRPYPEILQPVRPLVMWSYTDFTDPRFDIGARLVRLRSDSSLDNPQKFGVGNTLGWCSYLLEGVLFVKKFRYEPAGVYPDFGCNNEIYTAGSFIELESLSAMQRIAPGASAEHEETWNLIAGVEDDDHSIAEAFASLSTSASS